MPKLEAIFAEAVELQDPVQQSDFLDSACQENTLLRNRVGALIDANRKATAFMSEPAGIVDLDDFEASANEPVGEQPGDVIGRYELVEQIGEGGMGTVFRASQTEPVQRTVALKVVKPGLDTKEVIARFESERQALALMDHPHIARAYDAGATPSSRPYFVMEFVQGQSISEYCNANQLTTRERLELFLPICDAIQHAHQKGIIHRDIKPQNILITTSSSQPQPKVIDFGIAKATDQRLSEKTIQTQLGQFIGTPAYMSPEQADPASIDIDTRSDVYSLGATLYELLTGVAPFNVEELKTKTNEEICRVIREETPVQPSAAISTNRDAMATAVASARRVTPVQLKSAISGDLDWIVMRSLEKDRDRRYATAAALADDVHRYLNDEVIVARPPSTGYRLRKFAARNRAAVMTSAIVLATLLLATCLSSYFAYWAVQSLRVAQQQTQLANNETETLLGYVGFLNNDVFAQANPIEEPNRDVTLRFVLDRAAQQLAMQDDIRPDVEASVRQTLGATYRGLGEYKTSLGHLQRAHDLYADSLGTTAKRTAICGNELARTLLALARFDAAKSQLIRAMAVAEQQQDEELRLHTMQLLAFHSEAMGELQNAEALMNKVLAARRNDATRHPQAMFEAMANLAYIYQAQGRQEDAIALLEEAHAGLQQQDAQHPATLKAAVRMARLHTLRGDLAKAAQQYRDTVHDLARLFGERHAQTASAKHGWALVKASMNQHTEAKQLLEEVLEGQRDQLGDAHPATLSTMHNLARLQARLGNPTAAQSLFEEELAGQLKTHGKQHDATREALSSLAFFYMDQAKFGEAIPYYQQLAKSFRSNDTLIAVRLITTRSMLGLCHAKVGEHKKAQAVLETALRDCKDSLPESWLRPVIEGQLGEVYMQSQQRTAAEVALTNSYEQLKERQSGDSGFDIPERWRPMGLRAATRRLAEFYESSPSGPQQARAKEYRAEYEHICQFGSIRNDEQTGNTEDGNTN